MSALNADGPGVRTRERRYTPAPVPSDGVGDCEDKFGLGATVLVSQRVSAAGGPNCAVEQPLIPLDQRVILLEHQEGLFASCRVVNHRLQAGCASAELI
jgi:hypothetical protein